MWQIFIRVWFTYVTPGSHSWSGEYPRAKGPVLQSDVSPLHRMCVRQRHGVVDRGKTLHWESLNLNRKTIFFWAGTASLYPCWQCCRRLSLLTPGLRGTHLCVLSTDSLSGSRVTHTARNLAVGNCLPSWHVSGITEIVL